MQLESENVSSYEVSELAKRGDYILKKKKNAKGNHAWEQFRIVWDENSEEVFAVVCCANCKTCFLYKKLENGAEKSMGTKNLLDHLKYCVATQSTHHRSESTLSASSTETVESEGNTTTVTRALDSFVKRSGKKVIAVAKIRFIKELLLWWL